MRKKEPEIYAIKIVRPEGVSVNQLIGYMQDAIETWGGQLQSNDPLFYPWYLNGSNHNQTKYQAIQIKRLREDLLQVVKILFTRRPKPKPQQ